MTQEVLTQLSATELARRIAAGELAAREAVEAHIARIEAVNPALNAVVVKRYAEARAEASDIDRRRRAGEPLPPLAGVPVTVKESLDLEGTPSTFGVPTRAGHRAERDERHVARLRAAGAVVLGKTNVSQLLFYTEADNPLYGRTCNPWNASRTSGGSSGGEGAILAAGGSALGLGTDIGGSVRVPAAFCGICSLKPTSGRFPDPGRFSVPAGQQAIPSQVGVLARHVEDVALGTAILNGGRAPADAMPLGDWRSVDVGRLRVALVLDDCSFAPAPAVQRAVRTGGEVLAAAGAKVTLWTPPQARESLALLGRIFTADGLAGMRRVMKGSRRSPQIARLFLGAGMPGWLLAAMKPLLRALGQPTMAFNLEAFGPSTADAYWQQVEQQLDLQQAFAAALAPFDLVLAPPCALPAFTHGATRDLLTAGAYATLYNVLGYPAGIVPVSRVQRDEESRRQPGADVLQQLAQSIEQGSAGLPVAVQVVARPWQEHVALAAMAALEQALRDRPDYPRTPVDPAR